MVSILFVIISVTLFQAASAITLEYLGGVDQINSSYVDYFFYCKVNDEVLHWRANILSGTPRRLGSFSSSDTDVRFKTNKLEDEIRFVSLLLSNQAMDPVVHSFLVVSQLRDYPSFNFSVFCENTTNASESRSDTDIGNPLNIAIAHGIVLTQLLSRNITDNIFIHVFVCTIQEKEIILRVNNTDVLELMKNDEGELVYPVKTISDDEQDVIVQATDFTIRNATKHAIRDPDSAILVVNDASYFNVSCSNGKNDVYLQVNSIMATDATPTASPTSNNTSLLTTTVTSSSSLFTTNLMSEFVTETPSIDSNSTDANLLPMSSSKTPIIVGCVVGIGLFLLIVVPIVVLLCLCVRKHLSTTTKYHSDKKLLVELGTEKTDQTNNSTKEGNAKKHEVSKKEKQTNEDSVYFFNKNAKLKEQEGAPKTKSSKVTGHHGKVTRVEKKVSNGEKQTEEASVCIAFNKNTKHKGKKEIPQTVSSKVTTSPCSKVTEIEKNKKVSNSKKGTKKVPHSVVNRGTNHKEQIGVPQRTTSSVTSPRGKVTDVQKKEKVSYSKKGTENAPHSVVISKDAKLQEQKGVPQTVSSEVTGPCKEVTEVEKMKKVSYIEKETEEAPHSVVVNKDAETKEQKGLTDESKSSEDATC